MKLFELHRTEDINHTSGTGIVAQGVQFDNGYCALTWLTPYTSVAMYHSIDVLERIHGHEGKTKVVWVK